MTSIKVPPLGESIVEATISRWVKNEGDTVAPGETLVELETDKITVDVPAMANGVLKKRLKNEGDVVKVDEVLCEIEEGAAAAQPAASPPAEAQQPPAQPAAAQPAPTPSAPAQPAAAGEARVSPAAAKEAANRGVDASTVPGTGRGGVVSKADVIESGSAKPAASAPPAPLPPLPRRNAPTLPRPLGSARRERR